MIFPNADIMAEIIKVIRTRGYRDIGDSIPVLYHQMIMCGRSVQQVIARRTAGNIFYIVIVVAVAVAIVRVVRLRDTGCKRSHNSSCRYYQEKPPQASPEVSINTVTDHSLCEGNDRWVQSSFREILQHFISPDDRRAAQAALSPFYF